MAVLVQRFPPVPQVEEDLRTLVEGDPGLTLTASIQYLSGLEVRYDPSSDGPGQRLLAWVVAASSGTNLWIRGVLSTYRIGDQVPITRFGGVTDDSEAGTIEIVYDVEACGGQGYWVMDVAGSRVSLPGWLLLAHELTHAWHVLAGTRMQPLALEELIAGADENWVRSGRGLPLRSSRDRRGGTIGSC